MAGAPAWREDLVGPPPARLDWLAARGARLRAAFWTAEGPARGLMLLLPGRTEHLEKYAPVARRLAAAGFASAALDWRGQGLSDRDPGAARRGHVDDFAAYQDDLAALLDWDPVAGAGGARLMTAHSMGGCIGLRAMLSGRLDGLAAAVFSAPMWGLALPALMRPAARGLAEASQALGLGRRAAPGQGPDRPYPLSVSFEKNVLVGDPEVWARWRTLAQRAPELTTHAPTLGWLRAALAEMAALEAAPADPRPALILLGEDEAVVSARAIRARARRSPAATLAMIPGARHEPLMERAESPAGQVRDAALAAFLDRHAPRAEA